MNNYEDEILDELEYAENLYDIDSRAIKNFERDVRTQGKKKKKVKVEDKE